MVDIAMSGVLAVLASREGLELRAFLNIKPRTSLDLVSCGRVFGDMHILCFFFAGAVLRGGIKIPSISQENLLK